MERELIWSTAYRLDHWIRVLSIFTLIITGWYIHAPFFGGGEGALTMATARWLHFSAAYVLIFGLIVRVYMSFNSKFYADWRDFGLWKNLKGIPAEIAYYVFVRPDGIKNGRYNPLQAYTYLFLLLLLLLMASLGFSMYTGTLFGLADASDSFAWIQNLFGGETMVRNLKFLFTWFILIFILIHVYIVIVATYWDKDNTLGSMFSGYKNRKAEK